MSKPIKSMLSKVLFSILLALVICFFIWSKFLVTSLLLLLFADCISSQFLFNFLKRKLSKKAHAIVRYSSYVIFPIGLAIFCRVFIFETYSIPSSSMESTLSQGDRVVINKLSYGPKLPNSIEEVPFGKLISWLSSNDSHEGENYTRLPGFDSIQRHDIIVFKGFKEGATKKFIKRIIGLPGETLTIVGSKVSIDGTALEELPNYVFDYKRKSDKVANNTIVYSNSEFELLSTEKQERITRNLHKPKTEVHDIFPKEKVFDWNRDFYGAVTIPKKGKQLILTTENIIFYKETIALETQKVITIEGNSIYLDKQKIESYTFLHNYFFVMGDNRHFSRDSRAIGFVPEYTIQGKLWFHF